MILDPFLLVRPIGYEEMFFEPDPEIIKLREEDEFEQYSKEELYTAKGKKRTIQGIKEKRKATEEWREVEVQLRRYRKQFEHNHTEADVQDAKQAMLEMLERFYPLFRKYIVLIKSGHINFHDPEQLKFVSQFVGQWSTRCALFKMWIPNAVRKEVTHTFNFIRESYGRLTDEEIHDDLQLTFINLARRYEDIGKSFCAYIYHAFGYEFARFVKQFTRDVHNIEYKTVDYDEYANTISNRSNVTDLPVEDQIFLTEDGLPDMNWIVGEGCSDAFQDLSPMERKIIVRYYLGENSDRQIAEAYGMNVNIANQRRRAAVLQVAAKLKIDPRRIVRSRKNGSNVLRGMY